MAQISSYPIGSPVTGDLLVGTKTPVEGEAFEPNKTLNFTVGSIVSTEIPTYITGTTNTVPLFTGVNTIGDSPIFVEGPVENGLYQVQLQNTDRFIIDKPSSVTSGDPEYLITQDGNWKVSMGWDDDGEGFGYLYNWAGDGWRFGSAGNNPELTIVTTAGSEGVDIANDLTINGNAIVSGDLSIENGLIDGDFTYGTAGQVLSSTGSGQKVKWVDSAGGNVTGTGTTQTLPLWSEGPNGVLGDSAIKQHNDNNITIGSSPSSTTQGNYTLSVGNDNDFTSGTARVLAVGASNVGTLIDVVDSAVIGLSNEANSSYSLTVGQRNQTNSGTSFVAGVDNVTSSNAPRQFVIGRENNVDSVDTIVLGDRNTVTETSAGFGSMMIFGHLNNVLGDRILCLGTSNTVNSDNQGAYIIGVNSSSTADRTYSVGQQNVITGNESYAFGKSNTIEASASVAVGTNNSINTDLISIVSIEKAYAFGFGNSNINFKSFAIGDNNDVSYRQRTYLIGRENKPATDNTIILGQFSDPTVLRTNNTNGRSTVAFAVGSNDGVRRTAWEFRGKQTSTGDTSAGDSMQIMAWALLYSTSYTDDTAAGAGGVEIGQLYRTGSTVKIRMT